MPLGGVRQLVVRAGGQAQWWSWRIRQLTLPLALLVLTALFLVRERLRAALARRSGS